VPGIGRRRHGAVTDRTAGEAKSVPAEAGLASCETGEPLEPGTYELYARVMVIPDDGGSVESFGGPWPVEVR
jgi:hypothetical protein